MSQTNEHSRFEQHETIKHILTEIQTTREKLALLQGDRKQQRAYENYLLSCANALDVLRGHYELGRAEGIAIARKEAAYERARKMLQKGIAPTLIVEITGLTEAEITGLLTDESTIAASQS